MGLNSVCRADARRKIGSAAIVAGGLGTRLGAATAHLPKALVDVHGEPFIAHQLRLLHRNGVDRVVICAGHLGEMIQRTIGDGASFDQRIDYSFDGPALLGTGGAIRQALPLLGDTFFVVYGDSYLKGDYQAVARAFAASGKRALMTVFRNDSRWGVSNVEFRDGRIVRYDKKQPTPDMHHIDYGLGVFSVAAFDRVPPGVRCDLADVYADLLRREQLTACEVATRFYEIGSPEGLAELRAHLARRAPSI